MAQITQGVHLIHSTDGTTFARIGTDPNFLCIKDFPDMDNADTDQVEITTLCDDAHKYMDGLKNLPDELSFTANYDATLWGDVESLETTDKASSLGYGYWGIQIGTSGKKFYVGGNARMVLVGGGVGDVLEMRVVIKPRTAMSVA